MNYDNTEGRAQGAPMSDADLRRLADMLLKAGGSSELSAGRTSEVQKAPEASDKSEMTIDLVALMYFIISKLHFVILGMLVGALLLGYYAVRIRVPVFTATAKLFIVGEKNDSLVSMLDLQMGSALTNDYQEIFRTWEVHQMVNDLLGTDYPYQTLQSMVSIYIPDDTRIMYISVRNTDAQRAADIANAYINACKRFISETMDTEEPRMFSEALVPAYASSISVRGYAIRGFLLGAALSLGILSLMFLLDSRPKSTEDILRYGGIPTLAVIPANMYLSGRGRKSSKNRGGKR